MAAFEMLKTDYVDAVFDGLRKYLQIINPDGTFSFADVTQYTVKEGSFLGAKDINMMNTAMNLIMAALNNGTDLYEVFSKFFVEQQELFTRTADEYNADFFKYVIALKETMDAQWTILAKDYTDEIERFEDIQEAVYNTWFEAIKKTLSSIENGELLIKIEGMLRDMYSLGTDADIDAIIGGNYADEDDGSSIFEIASDEDIDELINGTYADDADDEEILQIISNTLN